jgi:hypothetical protein
MGKGTNVRAQRRVPLKETALDISKLPPEGMLIRNDGHDLQSERQWNTQ